MRSGENSSAWVRQDTTRGPPYAPAGTCARCATRMRPSWTRTTRPVRRCSASCTALRRSLVGVRGVPDAPAPQVIAAGPVAVGLVRGEAVGLLAGTAQSGAGNADFLQHGLELGAVRLLPWRDDQGQRATAAVRARVELAGEPSARAAQALTSSTTSTRRAARLCQGVSSWCSVTSAPFEAGAGGGSVRAPGTGSMLVSTDDGGVDRDVPVDLTCRVRRGLDLLKKTLPRSVCGPQPVAFVDGLPWAEPFGQVTPLNAGPYAVQNPVDHLAMIPPPATTSVADRQVRPQPFPLGICQITPPHVHMRSSHMIGRTSPNTPKRPQSPAVRRLSLGEGGRPGCRSSPGLCAGGPPPQVPAAGAVRAPASAGAASDSVCPVTVRSAGGCEETAADL
ncbi:hypothetical protein BX286_6737 [Streptomyces sp. 3211.6]|nr:hypothetical protein BX286_6737 [Streptomyces sp. 3211.6]